MNQILLGHGSGGKLSQQLIQELFFKYFKSPLEVRDTDAAGLTVGTGEIGFTTDSFVVDPLFFPGGNIGNLAVSGTVNDLIVSGYVPKYLSAGFIIEEGLPFSNLETVVKSMAEEAEKAGVYIVTGDTKVVDKGKCDKLFINTSGIGEKHPNYNQLEISKTIAKGDQVIVTGYIADHGMTVMAAREQITVNNLHSDVAPLNKLVEKLLNHGCQIKFMRDATRGGMATVLNEVISGKDFGITLNERAIPVRENVRGICELLGFDPLYVANEGKIVMVVDAEDADKVLSLLREDENGKESALIGEITESNIGLVVLKTTIGGKRIVDMLAGAQLPRIC